MHGYVNKTNDLLTKSEDTIPGLQLYIAWYPAGFRPFSS
jgi:hypothetical protein